MLFVEPEVDCFQLQLRNVSIPTAVLKQTSDIVAAATTVSAAPRVRGSAEPTQHARPSSPSADCKEGEVTRKPASGSLDAVSSASPSPTSSSRPSATVSASTRTSEASSAVTDAQPSLAHISLDERADALQRALLSALRARFPYEVSDTLEYAYVLVVTHHAAPSIASQPFTAEEVSCLTTQYDFLPSELRCRTFPSHLNAILDPAWTAAAAAAASATQASQSAAAAASPATATASSRSDHDRPSIRVTDGATRMQLSEEQRSAESTAAEVLQSVPMPPRFYDTFFLLARELTPAQQAVYYETQCRGRPSHANRRPRSVPPPPTATPAGDKKTNSSGGHTNAEDTVRFTVLQGRFTHFIPAGVDAESAAADSTHGAAALASAAQRVNGGGGGRRRAGESATYYITPNDKATDAFGNAAAAAPADVRTLHFSVYRIPLMRFQAEDQQYYTDQREEMRWRQRRRCRASYHAFQREKGKEKVSLYGSLDVRCSGSSSSSSSSCSSCRSSSTGSDEEEVSEEREEEAVDVSAPSGRRRREFDDVMDELFQCEATSTGADNTAPAEQRSATHFFETCHKVLTNYAEAHTSSVSAGEETASTTSTSASSPSPRTTRPYRFPGVPFLGVTRLLYSFAPCDCYHLVMKDNNPLYYAHSSRASYQPQTVSLCLVSDLIGDSAKNLASRNRSCASGSRSLRATEGDALDRATRLRCTLDNIRESVSCGAMGDAGRPSPGPDIAGKTLWINPPRRDSSQGAAALPPLAGQPPNTSVVGIDTAAAQRSHNVLAEDGLVQSRQPSPDRASASHHPSTEHPACTEGTLRVTASLLSNSISGNPRRNEKSLAERGATVPDCLLPDAVRKRGAGRSDSDAAGPLKDSHVGTSTTVSSAGAVVNLFRALAESSLAQHQLRYGTIRPVISVAVLDSSHHLSGGLSYKLVDGDDDAAQRDGTGTAAQMRESDRYCCRGLIDHTWLSLPVQRTPAEQDAIQWMPVMLGSTECVSDVGLRTAVHLGVFPPSTPDVAARDSGEATAPYRGGGAAPTTNHYNRKEGLWPTRAAAISSLTPPTMVRRGRDAVEQVAPTTEAGVEKPSVAAAGTATTSAPAVFSSRSISTSNVPLFQCPVQNSASAASRVPTPTPAPASISSHPEQQRTDKENQLLQESQTNGWGCRGVKEKDSGRCAEPTTATERRGALEAQLNSNESLRLGRGPTWKPTTVAPLLQPAINEASSQSWGAAPRYRTASSTDAAPQLEAQSRFSHATAGVAPTTTTRLPGVVRSLRVHSRDISRRTEEETAAAHDEEDDGVVAADLRANLYNEETPQAAVSSMRTARGGVAMTFNIDATLTGGSNMSCTRPPTRTSRVSTEPLLRRRGEELSSTPLTKPANFDDRAATINDNWETSITGAYTQRQQQQQQGRKAIRWPDAPHSTVPTAAHLVSTPAPRGAGDRHSNALRSSDIEMIEVSRDEAAEFTPTHLGDADLQWSGACPHFPGNDDNEEDASRYLDMSRSTSVATQPISRAAGTKVPNPFLALAEGVHVAPHTPPRSPRLPACFASVKTPAPAVPPQNGLPSKEEEFFDNPLGILSNAAPSPHTPRPRLAVQPQPFGQPSKPLAPAPATTSRREDFSSPLYLSQPRGFASQLPSLNITPVLNPAGSPMRATVSVDQQGPRWSGSASPSVFNGSVSAISPPRSSGTAGWSPRYAWRDDGVSQPQHQPWQHSAFPSTTATTATLEAGQCFDSPEGRPARGAVGEERPAHRSANSGAPPVGNPSSYFENAWNARKTLHTSADAPPQTSRAWQQQQQQQRPTFFTRPFGVPPSVSGIDTTATTTTTRATSNVTGSATAQAAHGAAQSTAAPTFPSSRVPARNTLRVGRFSSCSTRIGAASVPFGAHVLHHAAPGCDLSQSLYIDEYDDAAVRTNPTNSATDARCRVRPRGVCAMDAPWWQPVRELSSAPNVRYSSSSTCVPPGRGTVDGGATLYLSTSTDQPYNVSAATCDSESAQERRDPYNIPREPLERPSSSFRLSGSLLTGRFSLDAGRLPPFAPTAAAATAAPTITPLVRNRTRFTSGHRYATAAAAPTAVASRSTSVLRAYSASAQSAEAERRRHELQRQRYLNDYQQHLQENYMCGPAPKRFCFEKPPRYPVDAAGSAGGTMDGGIQVLRHTFGATRASAANKAPAQPVVGVVTSASGTTGCVGTSFPASFAWTPRTTAAPPCVPLLSASGGENQPVWAAFHNTHPSASASGERADHPAAVQLSGPPSLFHPSEGVCGGAAAQRAERRLREQAEQQECMQARRQMERLVDGEAASRISSGVNISFTLRDIAVVLLRLPSTAAPSSSPPLCGGLEVLDICSAAWRTDGPSCFLSRKPTRLRGGWESYLERINLYQEPFYLRDQALILLLPVPHVPELKVCVAVHNVNDVVALVCQTPVARILPTVEEARMRERRYGCGEDIGNEKEDGKTHAGRTAAEDGVSSVTVEERRWFLGVFTTRRVMQGESLAAQGGELNNDEYATCRAQCSTLQRQHQLDGLHFTWQQRIRLWCAFFQAGRTCLTLPACTSPLLTDPAACQARCALLCNRIAAYAVVRHRLETLKAIRHAYVEHRAAELSRQRVLKLCDAPPLRSAIRLGESEDGVAAERQSEAAPPGGIYSGVTRGGREQPYAPAPSVNIGFRDVGSLASRVGPGRGVALEIGGTPSSVSTWAALHGPYAKPPPTAILRAAREYGERFETTRTGQGGNADVGRRRGGAGSTAATATTQPTSSPLFMASATSVAPYASGTSLAPSRFLSASQQLQLQRRQEEDCALRAAASTAPFSGPALSTTANPTSSDFILHVERDDALAKTLQRVADFCTAAIAPPLITALAVVPRAAQPVRGAGAGVTDEMPGAPMTGESEEGVPFSASSLPSSTAATPRLYAGFVPSPVELQQRQAQPFNISIAQVQQLIQWQWEHHQHSYTLMPLPFFRGAVVPSAELSLSTSSCSLQDKAASRDSRNTVSSAPACAVSPLAREMILHLARWSWLLPIDFGRRPRRYGGGSIRSHYRNHDSSDARCAFFRWMWWPLSLFSCAKKRRGRSGGRQRCCRLPHWRLLALLTLLVVVIEYPARCFLALLSVAGAYFVFNGLTVGLATRLPSHRSGKEDVHDEWQPRLLLLFGPRIRVPRLWPFGSTRQQRRRHGTHSVSPCATNGPFSSSFMDEIPPLKEQISLLYNLSEATTQDLLERRREHFNTQAVITRVLRCQTGVVAVLSRLQLALCGYSTTLSLWLALLCLAYLGLYLVYAKTLCALERGGVTLYSAAAVHDQRSRAQTGVQASFADTTAAIVRQYWMAGASLLSSGHVSAGQVPMDALRHMTAAAWRDVLEPVRFLLLQRTQAAADAASDNGVSSPSAVGEGSEGEGEHGRGTAEPGTTSVADNARVGTAGVVGSGRRPSYFYQNGRYYMYDAEPPAWAASHVSPEVAPATSAGAHFSMTDPTAPLSSSPSAAEMSVSARVTRSLSDWVAQVLRTGGSEKHETSCTADCPGAKADVAVVPPTLPANVTSPLNDSRSEASLNKVGDAEPNLLCFFVFAYFVTCCLPRSPFGWLWGRVWGVLTHDDALARRPLLTV
jgi:hypothetical protein